MYSQNKFALSLVLMLQVLTMSLVFGADDHASQQQASSSLPEASAQTSVSQPQPTQKASPPKALSKTSVDGHGSKNAASGSASVPKTPDTKPGKASTATPGSGSFVQSAISSVDELVRSDESPKATFSNGSANVLTTRMAESMAKGAPVKAGTIDEQVREDGRREERVHTLGGSEYCVTFESPSDPKDGIDKMQYGLHPGGMTNGMSMHTCGHRFD
jgi:hypothetical protein